MPEHLHYDDEDLFNPETHHEESDVNVKGLFVFIGLFIVASVATWGIILLLYKGLARGEREERPLTGLDRPAELSVPQNQPLLRPFPRENEAGQVLPPYASGPLTELADIRAAEEKALHNYGWVDKEHGIVHLPITNAKQLALQRGLYKTVATPAAVATEPTTLETATGAVPVTTDTTTTTAPATTAPATGTHHR